MKNLNYLVPKPDPLVTQWRWATVEQVTPLRIRFDTEDTALPITPESLVGTVEVDDRVWCQIEGKRVIIHGVGGGESSGGGGGSAGVVRLNIVVLTVGSGNYVKPAGLLGIVAECQGAGAGSGATPVTAANAAAVGNGGGAGGYTKKWYPASALAASEPYTVGAGGPGGTAAAPATPATSGGNTTFKGMTASGGVGANPPARGPSSGTFVSAGGGPGGAATGGDINIPGMPGSGGHGIAGQLHWGGKGGESMLGRSAEAPTNIYTSVGAPAAAGTGYGSGATGGTAGQSQAARAGTTGQNGVIIITEYFSV